MKRLDEIRRILQDHKAELHDLFGVKEIGIFGSYVRKEATKKSDVDILVDFGKTPDFFVFLRLEAYLSKLLDARVDLVTRQALKPHIGKKILAEVVHL